MLEKELTTYEQSRKLYELGFRKPSIFYRTERIGTGPIIINSEIHGIEEGDIPAYLLSEIMEEFNVLTSDSIQNYIHVYGEHGIRNFILEDDRIPSQVMKKRSKIPVTAACDLLIWCIENGFISTK